VTPPAQQVSSVCNLDWQIRTVLKGKVPMPRTEYRFHPTRRWRMDLCFPACKIGIEVDGGVWIPGGGRHTRGAGFIKDSEKLNEAAILGYRMLRFTPGQVKSGEALETIERMFTEGKP